MPLGRRIVPIAGIKTRFPQFSYRGLSASTADQPDNQSAPLAGALQNSSLLTADGDCGIHGQHRL